MITTTDPTAAPFIPAPTPGPAGAPPWSPRTRPAPDRLPDDGAGARHRHDNGHAPAREPRRTRWCSCSYGHDH